MQLLDELINLNVETPVFEAVCQEEEQEIRKQNHDYYIANSYK